MNTTNTTAADRPIIDGSIAGPVEIAIQHWLEDREISTDLYFRLKALGYVPETLEAHYRHGVRA